MKYRILIFLASETLLKINDQIKLYELDFNFYVNITDSLKIIRYLFKII